MAPQEKRHRTNGARHRRALRNATANLRCLHLSAGAVLVLTTLRYVWRRTSLVLSYSSFLLSVALTMEGLAVGTAADIAVIHHVIELFAMNTVCFMSLLQIRTRIDINTVCCPGSAHGRSISFINVTDLIISSSLASISHLLTSLLYSLLSRAVASNTVGVWNMWRCLRSSVG